MEWEEKSTKTTATIKMRKEKRGERMPSVRIVDRRERERERISNHGGNGGGVVLEREGERERIGFIAP